MTYNHSVCGERLAANPESAANEQHAVVRRFFEDKTMLMKLLRCGQCGVFCDNHGNIFEATEQLIAADKHCGFDNALGYCEKCRPLSVGDIMKEAEISETLAKQKDEFYRRHGCQC